MMLAGVAGIFVSTQMGHAEDVTTTVVKAPHYVSAPAVDGINGKVDAFGGSIANRGVWGTKGAFSIPLGDRWGAQIDGVVGSFNHRAFGSFGGHLFWRDPTRALLGAYVSHTHWDQFGGVHVTQVAAEGEYYWQRWTLQGIAGVEFGNSASNTTSTTVVTPGGGGAPNTANTNTFIEGYDVKTRFFDQINLKYYLTDNWDAYVGHRYLGGRHALAVGTEYAMPFGRGMLGTGFIEARLGENDFHGIWGGFRFHFGQNDKPLIARHRQDDPNIWGVDPLYSIINNQFSNGSSSSSLFCDSGEPVEGVCGSPN
jgi:hypothetical protein